MTIPDVALQSATTLATTVVHRSAPVAREVCVIATVKTWAAPEGSDFETPWMRLTTKVRGMVTRVATPSRAMMIGKMARNQR